MEYVKEEFSTSIMEFETNSEFQKVYPFFFIDRMNCLDGMEIVKYKKNKLNNCEGLKAVQLEWEGSAMEHAQ